MNPFAQEGRKQLLDLYLAKLTHQMRQEALREAWRAYQQQQEKIAELTRQKEEA